MWRKHLYFTIELQRDTRFFKKIINFKKMFTRTKFSKAPTETGNKPKSLTKKMLEKTYELCLLGCTDKILAKFFDVAGCTIDYWKQQYPAFAEALSRGRMEADARVALALYQRAIGYSHPDTVILTQRVDIYDEDGNKIETRTEPLIVPTIKHYPPDTYAAHKWLTIRQRELWSETHKLEINGQLDVYHLTSDTTDYSTLTEQEIELAIKIGMRKVLETPNPN